MVQILTWRTAPIYNTSECLDENQINNTRLRNISVYKRRVPLFVV